MDFDFRGTTTVSGFGPMVYEIVHYGEVIGYLGTMDGREMIQITKALPTEVLASLNFVIQNSQRPRLVRRGLVASH